MAFGGWNPGSVGQNFSPDVGAVGQVMSAEKAANAGIKEAQIGAEASKFPYELKQQRFNQVFPWIQGELQGGLFGGNMARAGGSQVGTQPTINAGPIWNQNQIQQRVNSQNAQTDASTGTQLKGINEQAAGRGFGAGSPLAQALGTMAQNSALNTKVGQEESTRFNTAQGNAQQQLAGQQAQEQQFASRQQEDIERRKPVFGMMNALIGALGGLV